MRHNLVLLFLDFSYKLYEVYPCKEEQTELLKTYEGTYGVHFLSRVLPNKLNRPVNILVSPNVQDEFNSVLAKQNIRFKEVIENFERTLDFERKRTKYKRVAPGEISFDAYHRYNVITNYLKAVALKHSDFVTLLNIGKTTEGRDILALKISNGEPKPIILINAGAHSREWIAPPQALYIIQQLVENPNNNKLIKNVDWIIIPILNPDGYEFSHTTDRLWRKTRSKGLNCTGTDLNRNFDFHWGEKGASFDECSDTYHGRYAFSEPESRALRDLILKYASQIKLFISFHSFGQLILYPWGNTAEIASNAAELQLLGNKLAKTIKKVAGTSYTVGPVASTLYYVSGDYLDWSRGVAGLNLTFIIELPPKIYTFFEFKLPSEYIKAVVTEIFEGIKVSHSYVENMTV